MYQMQIRCAALGFLVYGNSFIAGTYNKAFPYSCFTHGVSLQQYVQEVNSNIGSEATKAVVLITTFGRSSDTR